VTGTQRIAVFSAVRLFCDGLVELLRAVGGAEIVAVASTDTEAIQRSGQEPDVVLLQAFNRDDVLAARSLLRSLPEARLIAVGVPEVEDVIVACAEAGVSGYVRADASIDDLVKALGDLAMDRPSIPPSIAAVLLNHLAIRTPGQDDIRSNLTAREVEIARCLGEGLSNKEIARRLQIDVSTVKNHIHSVLQKLHVRRRVQVARILREC
jgi:DNA-binding NarL/FixJ family response regulator